MTRYQKQLKTSMLWEPVWWGSWGHYGYRMTHRNGIQCPGWVTPIYSVSGVVHDICSHMSWSTRHDVFYEDYFSSNINELWAAGINMSFDYHPGMSFAISQANFLLSGLDKDEDWNIEQLPKFINDNVTSDLLEHVRYSTYDREVAFEYPKLFRRLLMVAKEGYNYGKQFPRLRHICRELEGSADFIFKSTYGNKTYGVDIDVRDDISKWKGLHRIFMTVNYASGKIWWDKIPLTEQPAIYEDI